MKNSFLANAATLLGITAGGAALASACALTGTAIVASAILKRRRTVLATPSPVVLITGGSRGLGLALANRFARAGARLVLASRNLAELTQARQTLLQTYPRLTADNILLVPADLTDPAQVSALIDQAIARFGHIDILINNAAIIEVGPVENQPLDAYTRAMNTNFFAALYTTHAALPHLLRRAVTHPAAIVNIASIGGKFAMPHMLPYVAAKFALTGFSEGLHAELRHKGVRVTTVCPGLMRTGGESHAHFTGQVEKEQRWFNFSAKTPIVAASVTHAANRIYNAVAAGRAEITITPQAWLAARFAGFAPETTQFAAAQINHYLLPAPANPPQALKAP